MRKALVQEVATDLYDSVTDELARNMPPGEDGATFVGIERTVRGMPVTREGRRPVIGVDHMEDFQLPYEREPTHVSARVTEGQYHVGRSAVRLTFARPEGSTALYGPPISVGLDFGVGAGKEGEPAYSAFSVVLKRGEVPSRIEVQQGDEEWRPLKTQSGLQLPSSLRNRSPDWNRPKPRYYKGHEALFLGGVIYQAMTRDGRPTNPVFDPAPGDG
jgi:hypothetical protein